MAHLSTYFSLEHPASSHDAKELKRELDTLPGIGPARAQAILDYRREHGPFRYVEELVYVDGIGEGILAGLMDLVSVGDGETQT